MRRFRRMIEQRKEVLALLGGGGQVG